MSKTTRTFPAAKFTFGSRKRWKQLSHRLFRQRERMAMRTGNIGNVPYHQWQIVNQWNVTDVRVYFGDWQDEYYRRMMRK